MPEGKLHLILKTLLWQTLETAYRGRHGIGCGQLVYFNGRDPRRCCTPDVFVKLQAPQPPFACWKTWEWGTPELAIEIDSRGGWDGQWSSWDSRIERYRELGVSELVRLVPDAPEGERLAVWDRMQDDLVERVVDGVVTPCTTLGLWWLLCPCGEAACALRLARDAEGTQLLP